MTARAFASAVLTISLAIGVAGSASATFIVGEVQVFVSKDIVDTDLDLVLGGAGLVQSKTGDFSGLGPIVSLGAFSYGEPLTSSVVILLDASTGLTARAETIDLVVEEITGSLVEEVTLVGTGTLEGGGFDVTAMSWELVVGDVADTAGAFTLTAEGDPGGTGTGSSPTPEPSAALLFGIGLLVAAGSIRRA